MPENAITRPQLDDDLLHRLGQEVMAWVAQADRDTEDRDEVFAACREQLQGAHRATTEPLVKGGSDIDDPLTREQHTNVVAAFRAAISGPQLCVVEATRDDLKDKAVAIEHWIHDKIQAHGGRENLADAAYHMAEMPVAWSFVGWDERVEKRRKIVQVDEDGNEVMPDVLTEGMKIRTEMRLTEEVKSGIVYRAPHPADILLYPSDCADVDRAVAIIERMRLTSEELLAGVSEMGYEEDAVLDMIQAGPGGEERGHHSQADNERDGITPSEDPYFTVYQVIGRLPLLLDGGTGEIETPAELRHEDFYWIVCPSHNAVLKFEYSPFPKRPYVKWNMLRVPNRAEGECVPTLLESLQAEATANLRWTIDSGNLTLSPMLKVSEQWQARYGTRKIQPGGVMPWVNDPGEVEPLIWDKSGVPMGMELQGYIDTRAAELIASRALQMDSKVRKAAEVQAGMQTVSAKFDLYLSYFNDSLERWLLLHVLLYQEHMHGDDTLMVGGKPVTVTAQDLKEDFKFIPYASSDHLNREMLVREAIEMMTQIRQSPIYQRAMAAGDMRMEWQLLRDFVTAMRKRNPEAYTGPEPPAPDVLQAIVGRLGEFLGVDPQMLMSDPGLVYLLTQLAGGGQSVPMGIPPAMTVGGMPGFPPMMEGAAPPQEMAMAGGPPMMEGMPA